MPWLIWSRPAVPGSAGDWQEQLRLLNGLGSALAFPPRPTARTTPALPVALVITSSNRGGNGRLGAKEAVPGGGRWMYSGTSQLFSRPHRTPVGYLASMLCVEPPRHAKEQRRSG